MSSTDNTGVGLPPGSKSRGARQYANNSVNIQHNINDINTGIYGNPNQFLNETKQIETAKEKQKEKVLFEKHNNGDDDSKYDKNRQHTALKKSSDVETKNALVVLLAISEYEAPFSRLVGVKYDSIANRRFWSSLGYKIFPSREDTRWYGKMYWTKTEIMQYFDNIIDTKLLDDTVNRKLLTAFDGIIVIISCHGGQNDVIYSSDKQPVSLHDIYNQFGAGPYIKNNQQLKSIAKIFIVDACRGGYDTSILSEITELGNSIETAVFHIAHSQGWNMFMWQTGDMKQINTKFGNISLGNGGYQGGRVWTKTGDIYGNIETNGPIAAGKWYIENVLSFLDVESEWYYDKMNQILYYWPN
eukprot:390110_1